MLSSPAMSFVAQGVIVREPNAPPKVEDIVLDPPGPGEVRIRVLACGVCHTDLHAQRGHFGKEFPYLLGHEAAGVVDALGDGVTRLRLGQTVVITWQAPCGACRFCDTGRPVMCARPAVAGPRMRTTDGKTLGRVLGVGAFATHTVVAARQAIPIDPDLSPSSTCLLGCGVATGVGAALFAAAVRPGDTVCVYGCGAVGMSVLAGSRLARASRIVAVDLVEKKLEWARRFGATDVVCARGIDAPKRVREILGGTGARVAFEAIGLPDTLAQAFASADTGGLTVLIGVPQPGAEVRLPMTRLFYGRSRFMTTFGGDCLPARDFPLFADLYRKKELDLDALVTGTIGLDGVPGAFAEMERGEALRSVVVMSAT
jgi:S-(hydroxymethyl)mycothiol dehydrogenase